MSVEENREADVIKTILFVCTGNTCRSAMAEQIFRSMLIERGLSDKYTTRSVGCFVTEHQMNQLARQALEDAGYECRQHIPKALSPSDIQDCFEVVCMQTHHKQLLINYYEDNRSIKTSEEIISEGDIPDPYGGDLEAYKISLKRIEGLCKKIISDIIEYGAIQVKSSIDDN